MIRIKLISLIFFIICKFKYDLKFILVYFFILKIVILYVGIVMFRLVLVIFLILFYNFFNLYFFDEFNFRCFKVVVIFNFWFI